MTRTSPVPSHPRARRRSMLAVACLMGLAMVVAGCTQMAPIRSSATPPAAPSAGAAGAAKTASQSKPSPAQFSDLPIPQGAKLNVDKTLVVGTQTWYGQLSLDTSHNADTMFDFYSRELANYGWRRIAAVRAPTSILTYDRDERVLAIAITPSRVYGSEITITVSPREQAMPAMPGGPMGGPAGAPTGAPTGATVGPGADSPMGGQMGVPGGGPMMPPPVRQ